MLPLTRITTKRNIAFASSRLASTKSTSQPHSSNPDPSSSEPGPETKDPFASNPGPKIKEAKKTQAELDEDLRLKLEGISGEGGAAGLEYENGKAVSMKRGVRDNMFRYI